jgi:arylsulfatase A-like enzyme/Tfp pilus assembly protein PilF
MMRIGLAVVLLASNLALAAVPAKKPNVLLITIDTVRADHVGCYGYGQIKTPTLDALAHDGVVFERAISQVPLTWPSHAAILTGTYPFQNGVQDFTGQPLEPRFRSVAQSFQQAGYATGAVVSAFVLDRSWGLARGFDFYDDRFSAETFAAKDIGLVDRKAGESVDHAITWLKKRPAAPFFFWLHLYDPHSPYDPPEPFRSAYRDRPYDGEIAYADQELGRLIAYLKQNHLYDSTLVVMLSDHGESLGEHGEKEHGFFVYNATVHIPLIVKPPAGSGIRPGRVARPVETVAVAPTLLELAGLKNDLSDQEKGRRGLFGADVEKRDAAYSETFYPFSSFGWSPLHATETAKYHYIEAPQPELYDVETDPGEKNNLATQQAGAAAVLKDKITKLQQEHPFSAATAGSGLSPDAQEKLRALGYVAYRSPVSAAALAAGLPDPKDKLWEFNSILEAADAFQVGNFDAGEATLAKVREKDPSLYIVPFMIGEAASKRQDWEKAAAELKRCLELNPNFDEAMVGLARAEVNLGDVDAARPWIEKALKSNPQNYRAWYEKGVLEARSDREAAAEAWQKAVSIQPNFALGHRDLGMLDMQQKRYSEAAIHLEKAVELGMRAAPLLNFLGICYAQTGKPQKAVASYKAAIQEDPNLAEAHLNLAYAYQKASQPKAAEQEYAEACRLNAKFCGAQGRP